MVNHINNNEILKPKGVISDFFLIQLSTASTNTKAMPDRTIRQSQFLSPAFHSSNLSFALLVQIAILFYKSFDFFFPDITLPTQAEFIKNGQSYKLGPWDTAACDISDIVC